MWREIRRGRQRQRQRKGWLSDVREILGCSVHWLGALSAEPWRISFLDCQHPSQERTPNDLSMMKECPQDQIVVGAKIDPTSPLLYQYSDFYRMAMFSADLDLVYEWMGGWVIKNARSLRFSVVSRFVKTCWFTPYGFAIFEWKSARPKRSDWASG